MNLFLILYFAISLVNCFNELYPKSLRVRFISTPLAIPMLILWVLTSGNAPWLLVVGLLGSTSGDLFLMFPEKRDRKFFLAGTISFILTHVAYILFFTGTWSELIIHPLQWAGAIILVAATVILFLRMRKNLGLLQIPVAFYSLLLVSTACIILFSFSVLPLSIFIASMAGILLFLLSDTALSQDWFIEDFKAARFTAMITYLAAQFLLVWSVMAIL